MFNLHVISYDACGDSGKFRYKSLISLVRSDLREKNCPASEQQGFGCGFVQLREAPSLFWLLQTLGKNIAFVPEKTEG